MSEEVADTLAAPATADTFERQLAAELGDGAVAAPLAAGVVVAGKYRIVAPIGSGGMGQVYRATHLTTGGDVAVKVTHRGEASAQQLRRFALEAQNAASLSHTNTVRVTDFGSDDDGTLYLVMELVDGDSLDRIIALDGALTWRRAVRILRQVLAALWEAHEHPRRIVHRDIKPANILVTRQPGQGEVVKVADFGISRALDGAPEALTGTAGIIGSPLTMAPEQWLSAAIDARTDLYALGCTAYEMLSGRPVFASVTSRMSLGHHHIHERPVPLTDVAPPGLPLALAAWVDRMMAKRPDDRFASAAEALEALEAIDAAAGEGASLPPARPPQPLLWRRVAWVGLSAIAVALVGFLVYSAVFPAYSEREAAVPVPIPDAPTAQDDVVALEGDGAAPAALGVPFRRQCSADGCAGDYVGWCDAAGKPIACCGKGLVPHEGGGGVCVCAPGGALAEAALGAGCARATSSGPDSLNVRIREVMHAATPHIRRCYERRLAQHTALEGKFAVSFAIGPVGEVYDARIKSAVFGDADVQTCVLDQVRGLRFPPPPDGWVRVSYPLILHNKE